MTSLEQFINESSAIIERIFNQHGEILPMFHCITRSGEEAVMEAPRQLAKDFMVLVVREVFKQKDVVRYVFIDEAWEAMIDQKDYHPGATARDYSSRREVVTFMGEDEIEGHIFGSRQIHRPKDDRPHLGELSIHKATSIEGRMTGLLPRKGVMQ